MLIERWTGLSLGRTSTRVAHRASDGLLLVAHGSSCCAGTDESKRVGEIVTAARPDLAVELGFLELADPSAGRAFDALAARGCRRVVVQPLILLAAGHGKNDVPAVALEARERHPEIDVVLGSPLGVVPELLEIAASNLGAARASGLPLLVVARGTSDPDANADAMKAARLLAEWTGTGFVDVGFTGVTWPNVPDVLDRMARLGHQRIAVFFWFLANGKLVERARDQIAASGLDVIDAGYFGPDPALVPIIEQRRDEAINGVSRVSCDTCSYRKPWPGLEDRVAQPIGVGHSHLAVEHRHAHTHHHH
jgi:cobalt/nickel transport system ATP-binding protein